MIVSCPSCSARYRIESERMRPEGVRLRCARCEAVFQVTPSGSAAGSARPPDSARAEVAPPRPAVARAPAAPPQAAAGDRSRLVLIADPEVEQGKATAGALAQWGLQPTLVHDGVEAMLAIQRLLPRAVVIDAALPKMFGFQVCEIVKRNESLRDIHVVLVGAIHDRNRYRRTPEEIYGADAYLERQDLPASLYEIFRKFGMLLRAEPAPQAPAPPAAARVEVLQAPTPPAAARVEAPRATRAPAAPRAAPPSRAAEPASDLEAKIREAERLARIVVSDIVLYSQPKFDAAVRAGNVLEAMKAELAEGRSLFAARVDPAIQQQRDFLADELLRVAATRSRG